MTALAHLPEVLLLRTEPPWHYVRTKKRDQFWQMVDVPGVHYMNGKGEYAIHHTVGPLFGLPGAPTYDGKLLDLPITPPPFQHQASGIQWALPRSRILWAWDRGAGKTHGALCFATHILAEHVLVLCPAGTFGVWEDALENPSFAGLQVVLQSNDGSLARKGVEQPPDGVEQWDLVIVDEAHLMKNPTSKRTKALTQVQTKRMLFMSGTPMPNGPMEMFNLFTTLYPDFLAPIEKWKWAKRYCGASKQMIPALGVAKWVMPNAGEVEVPERYLAELEAIFDQCAHRVYKRDFEHLLPGVIVDRPEIPVATTTARKLQYLRHAIELKTSRALRGELLQATWEAKREHCLLDAVDMYERSGGWVCIAAWRKSVLADIREDLLTHYGPDLPIVVFSGAQAPKTRIKRQRKLKTNLPTHPKGFFLTTLGASQLGIDLTFMHKVLCVESHYTPAVMAQFIDRFNRLGQEHPVEFALPYAANSLDERWTEVLSGKLGTLERTVGISDEEKDLKDALDGDEHLILQGILDNLSQEELEL